MTTPPPRFDAWAARWDAPSSGSHGLPLFSGFLEPAWGCMDVVRALVDTIRSNKEVLPQKYLYSSLHGARLWKALCDGHSHIAEVYRKFPLNRPNAPFTDALAKQAAELVKSSEEKKLAVVVLGSGTGQREADICRWLADRFDLKRLYAVLVDVSSELLGVSLQKFNNLPQSIRPLFGVLDFESDAGLAHLQSLRNAWGEHPALFLFLGNTLGNVDEVTFLKRIAQVMRPEDLILCEMLLTPDTERRQVYDPHMDRERANFIVDPLRALGLNPKLENLSWHVTSQPGKWIRSEFRYHFDADDEAQNLSIEPAPTISEGNWVGLLEIQADTLDGCREVFERVFQEFQPAVQDYDVEVDGQTRRVQMAYCFARSPRAKSRVTAKQGAKSGAAPTGIVLNNDTLAIEFDSDSCVLAPTHFALVAVLEKSQSSWKALDVQREVVAWLEQYSLNGDNLDGKAKSKLASLKAGVTDHDTNPVSLLKNDTQKGLRQKATKHTAATELLKYWPEDEQWIFRNRT
ncbi:MAG TPA: L-histidine N(alpha)-methyltransferase [Verrucomicrobiota bacterium]|nr:L-histidine N(alpha)-methyltransferase [Verrucomicrobiota bacterium]